MSATEHKNKLSEIEVKKLRTEISLLKKKNQKTSEDKFKNLSDSAFEGVAIHQDGKVVEINKAACKTFGHSKKEILGKPILSFVAPEFHKVVVNNVKKGITIPYQIIMLRKGNKKFWVEILATKTIYNGQPARVTALRDISLQKENELKLLQSQLNYKNLIDNSPDGIIILINNKIAFANPVAAKLLEGSFKDLYNKPKSFFLPKKHQKQVEERFVEAIKGHSVPFQEFNIKTIKGNLIEVETKPINILYDGKDAILVVLHDITSQKLLIKEQLRTQLVEEANQKLQQEINEREKTERILKYNQNYNRLLIDSSLDMIVATDNKGNIVEFNNAAQIKFGYELKDVIGRPVRILYVDTSESTHITHDELYGKGFYVGEVNNVKKNGEKFISFLSASVLKNEEGVILGAMGVSRDVSEEKIAEQELRASEERYRAIFSQAYIGIAKISLQGQFLQVNQQLCNILGYTEDELYQKVFVDITAPEDMNLSIDLWDKFLRGEIEKANFEKKYLHKSGKIVFTNLTVSMVLDAEDKPSHFISVFQDISERRKTEKEQYAQAAKLNAVFESSSHIVWTADRDACITSFNNNYKYFIKHHYHVELQAGMSMMKPPIVSTEENNLFWKTKYLAATTGLPQHFESKMIDKSGTEVWYEVFLNPIFDQKKQVVEVSGIAHDITAKIKTDEKIQQSLQEKEILLKEVHHRVKNNLQVISSILNLQSSYVKDQNTLNILRDSQNRIKSMAFIHESLYQTKDFTSINFSDYVINLSDNLLHTYSNAQYDIKLKLDIETIFLNLDLAIPAGLIINEIITNSIKYAFDNEKAKNEILISMHNAGENLKLKIGDNGVGLPDHIDFRNTESLGLQLVTTLVDQLNGAINIENKNGTIYTIIFKQQQSKNRI